ncbi:hypothetical protein XENTR_v10007469 [Xenopus tropicalis]|nr:hypothetical protein XENTR_v10007469 [Xenopus tropicalis]
MKKVFPLQEPLAPSVFICKTERNPHPLPLSQAPFWVRGTSVTHVLLVPVREGSYWAEIEVKCVTRKGRLRTNKHVGLKNKSPSEI